tara:strand:- start:2500 stop:3141 length:642 start_codon:yes stop_codon:yes gene_type:complete
MKKIYLTSVSEAFAEYPKKLLLWNYWDHEHVVGTHFLHYRKVKILYEDEKVCYSEREAKMPFIPFYLNEKSLGVLENENRMIVWHSAIFNLIRLKQVFQFEEVDQKCKVVRSDFLEVPSVLNFLQPMFNKIMKKWFIDVWNEDMPMRERRFKVWKLGFKDFKGLDYINDKNLKKNINVNRPYALKLPLPKITKIKDEGSFRKFKKSKHLGYGL